MGARGKSLIVLTALLVGQIPAAARGMEQPAPEAPRTAPAQPFPDRLRSFTIQSLSAPAARTSNLDVAVSLDGVRHVLNLTERSLRSAEFKVLVQGPDAKLHAIQPPNSCTYYGQVQGVPESRVAASVLERGIHATIALDAGTIWAIQPATGGLGSARASDEHVVYRAADVIPGTGHCGMVDVDGVSATLRDWPGMWTAAPNMKACDIAFDSDVEFYQANNQSVEETVWDIENVMNGVTVIYENEVDVTYEISTIVVRTAEPDPYTSTAYEDLLDEFRDQWNGDMTWVHRDIAHLMTGRNIDNDVIGAAHLDSMCEVCPPADGYGFSQSTFSSLMLERVFLTAHEVGHNWGARHCEGDVDCGIMCSVIGGCSGNYTEFGVRSETAISDTAATAPCLATLAEPSTFPFCETFEEGMNTGRWSYVAAAEASPAPGNPPSPPYALRLDNCCTACANAPDEIRSNFIELGIVEEANLTYFTQHRGGPASAGSQLVVEYWSADQAWIEINRIVSTGVDQAEFDSWVYFLPADALHDEFRLRLRLEPVSNSDAWYVDSIAITAAPPISPVLYVDGEAPPGGGGADWGTAYDDLRVALSVAPCFSASVEEIWVREGVYTPDQGTGDRSSTFRLAEGLALLGGFAGQESRKEDRTPHVHETILSGDIGIPGDSLDNSYHVVTFNGVTGNTLLDGVTISGGRANAPPIDGGGGIRIVDAGPTIRDCVLRDNLGTRGAAMYLRNSTPVVTDCAFINNSASVSGGGAAYVTASSIASFANCAFFGNTAAAAFGGGVYIESSNAAFENCLFSGNRASSGAAIYGQSAGAALTNCTVSANTATASVGGILSSNSSINVNSCILWSNHDNGMEPEAAQIAGANLTIDYTCIEGWIGSLGGTGNTGVDPMLADLDGADDTAGTTDDDARLTPGSAAINSGDPNVVEEPGVTDLAGGHRVLCGRVDMGAYEFGRGDFDCNQTMDSADVAGFPACLTGPAGSPVEPGCATLDYDVDNDVDLTDFRTFQNEVTFPERV